MCGSLEYLDISYDTYLEELILPSNNSVGLMMGLSNDLDTLTIPSGLQKFKISYARISGSVIFEDTSTWYVTTNSDYTGGTQIDVTNPSTNVTHFETYLYGYYDKYYWYKV